MSARPLSPLEVAAFNLGREVEAVCARTGLGAAVVVGVLIGATWARCKDGGLTLDEFQELARRAAAAADSYVADMLNPSGEAS